MPILCDTICVWALYFKDSAYRRHVLELRSKHKLAIPDICLIEASYPIYGAKGLKELKKYSKFVENLPVAPGIKILETDLYDLATALTLATKHPDIFIDREGNLCLFNALIASLWLKTKNPLATTDTQLIKLGKLKNLKTIKLKKAKLR